MEGFFLTITEKFSSVPLRSTPTPSAFNRLAPLAGGGVLSSELKLGGMTIIFEPKASQGQKTFSKVRQEHTQENLIAYPRMFGRSIPENN